MLSYRYYIHHQIHIIIVLLLFASVSLFGYGDTVTIFAVDAFLVVPTRLVGNASTETRKRSHVRHSAKRTYIDTSSIPDITRRMQAVTKNPNIAIVIDLENVRGKTSFELDHADLLDRLMIWTSLRNYANGRTLVVVDHGRTSSAHLLRGHNSYLGHNREHTNHDAEDNATEEETDASMCVSFAGPRVKADDIIARDVKWLISSPDTATSHIVLVTADQELTYRCRNAVRLAGKKRNTATFSMDSVVHNSILRSFLDDSKRSNGRRRGRIKQAKEGGRKKKSRAARKLNMAAHKGTTNEEDEENEDEETEGESVETISVNATDTTVNTTAVDTDEQQQHDFIIPTIEVISPQRFLEDLGQSLHEWLQLEKGKYKVDDGAATNISSEAESNPIHSSQYLFQLRAKILSLEMSLRSTCSLHKRKGLTGELRKCKEEWKAALTSTVLANSDVETGDKQELFSSLACTFSSAILLPKSESDDGNASILPPSSSTAWERLAIREQDKLLMATRQENTGDRVVLAERLRRQLLELVSSDVDTSHTAQNKSEDQIDDEAGGTSTATLADTYANYINAMLTAP